MGAGELLGDLKAGVAATDNERSPLRKIARSAVADGVRLEDLAREVLRQPWDVRRLERTGRDYDLIGRSRPSVDVQREAFLLGSKLMNLAVQLHWEVERFGVALEVVDHLIARRIPLRVAGEGKPRQAAVPPRGEERQGVPAFSPGGPDRIGSFENDERNSLLPEGIAHRKTRLARADDRYFHRR